MTGAIVVQVIENSSMADKEKQDMADRLIDDFKAKKIAFEDLARVLENVVENPLGPNHWGYVRGSTVHSALGS